ncbi:LysR substrate-binding domain-containing protein [Thalassospira sp.]|uniref:LysR family transcriptional regulator n=1 Tax=Thalassospira sp. TaxID=1912094 RepID=UPI0027369701|nr:LysR substrate-binding domain-containing protein [Thalassospira sp.]MDP2700382.1 LysR substrate-binding domain-containing protein [Thalassospira sp.]
MNLRELESFNAFMTHGSVTRAAQAMNISQPMVSRLLTNFEKSVGFPLFMRKRNQLVATAEAQQFHSTVLRSLNGLRELETQARAIANQQLGSIRIAAQPIYVDTYLLDVVAKFKRAHPNVSVSITDTGLEGLLELVTTRECDLGIGITLDMHDRDVAMTPLAQCRAVCLMPRDHRLAGFETIDIDLLRGESFVELSIGSPLRTKIDYIFQIAGWPRKIAVEARTIRTVSRLVERNVGIAVIDPFAALLVDDKKVVARPLTPAIDWDVAVFHGSRDLSNVQRSFLGFLRAEIPVLRDSGCVL